MDVVINNVNIKTTPVTSTIHLAVASAQIDTKIKPVSEDVEHFSKSVATGMQFGETRGYLVLTGSKM